jgi:V/A-type H+-transporting ATPase subunit F
MLGFVIGDNDMITGFRLVGLEGKEVTSVEEARLALSGASKRKDVAIIVISEEFSIQMRKDIDEIRSEQITPLILEVPGRKGPSGEIRMSDLVSKTLGIRV